MFDKDKTDCGLYMAVYLIQGYVKVEGEDSVVVELCLFEVSTTG